MDDDRINSAARTIADTVAELNEVLRRLAGLPVDELETERTARILDRLSEDLAEAAEDVRGRQP